MYNASLKYIMHRFYLFKIAKSIVVGKLFHESVFGKRLPFLFRSFCHLLAENRVINAYESSHVFLPFNGLKAELDIT